MPFNENQQPEPVENILHQHGNNIENIPPKPTVEESKIKVNVWVKSFVSLVLYIAIGYVFFNQNWTLVLILSGVVIFHESGHFFAMKIYKYSDLGIFFIPLMGAYVSGTKQTVSQKQSAVILLAGPVPGIVAGIILHYLSGMYDNFLLERIAWILIYLNILNLLPVYPLDGGQLLNRLFFDSYHIVGKIFIVLSAGALAYFAWRIAFYPLFIFPLMMLMRLVTDVQSDKLTTRIEEEGINLDTSYEDISDAEYWKIRNALIKHSSDFSDLQTAPPYQYAEKENKVMQAIQNLLQRSLYQDLSIAGKITILLLWIGCFFVPVLLHLPLRFF